MGLDTTHGAWHGAYSAFYKWRTEIAKFAGYPPLELMEGYYHENDFALLEMAYPKGDEIIMYRFRALKERFPIKWEGLKPSPLQILLHHSDCEGDISPEDCKAIADALTELLEKAPADLDLGGHIGNFRQKTQTFIDGCLEAYKKNEKLVFH
jgi:hypothetical protein